MLPLQRKNEIKKFISERGFASVIELSNYFNVSVMTIRRDLNDLEEEGVIQRSHGGAVKSEDSFAFMSTITKADQYSDEKARIGKMGASLINDGDTIALDSGTTTYEIAKNLMDKKITVITNAINILLELMKNPKIEILFAGGIVQRGMLNTLGYQTDSFIAGYRADKAFIGIEGLHTESGITILDPTNAHSKQMMIAIARETIVVCDHSKINRVATSFVAKLNQISFVITDNGINEDALNQLEEYVKVITV